MRETEDAAFGAYAAARWVPLVRVVALLGTPDHLAADVVRAALARTRAAWSGRDPIDPDVTTCQALLVERRLADAWWITATEQATPAGRRADLESRLDRLTVQDRSTLLLRAVLGLGDGLAGSDATTTPSAAAIRAVAETIRVEPYESEAVAEVARRQGRDRVRRSAPFAIGVAAAFVVVALLAGAGATTNGTADPIPEATDPATGAGAGAVNREPITAEAATNPAPVPWYAEGSLHLDQSTLEIPTVRRAAQIGNGGVVLTYAGDLMLVDDAGVLTPLADLSDLGLAASFVVSDSDGLVAWVEAEPDPDPLEDRPVTLIVRDTTRRIDLLRMFVDRGSIPVAVDSRAVFFNQDAQSVRITLGRQEYVQAPLADDITFDPRQLVAAAGPSRIYQVSDGRLEVEHNSLLRVLQLPGAGGELSDDGRYLATRTFTDETSAYGEVAVYDLLSGDQLDSGVDPSRHVPVDVALGPDDTVSYLLADVGPTPGGQVLGEAGSPRLDLLTCNLSDRYLRFARAAGEDPPDRCSVQARIPASSVATFLGQ